MADETTKDELEPGEGKVLPQREMMSLISTDPADPMYSSLTPSGGTVAPPVDPNPPMHILPVEGADGDGDVDSDQRSETISQSDSASAG
jgi:hypothetical protein